MKHTFIQSKNVQMYCAIIKYVVYWSSRFDSLFYSIPIPFDPNETALAYYPNQPSRPNKMWYLIIIIYHCVFRPRATYFEFWVKCKKNNYPYTSKGRYIFIYSVCTLIFVYFYTTHAWFTQSCRHHHRGHIHYGLLYTYSACVRAFICQLLRTKMSGSARGYRQLPKTLQFIYIHNI